MNVLVSLLIGYIALVSVIWLHEFGHAYPYVKFGCKKNPFQLHVPFYLFGSTPQPVDFDRLSKLSENQKVIAALGGVTVNLLFGLPLAWLAIKVPAIRLIPYIYEFLLLFTLFHLLEAISYISVNTIFVASDMRIIYRYKPSLKIPLFSLGVLLIWLVYSIIIHAPETMRGTLIGVSVTTVMVFGFARVIFSAIVSRKATKDDNLLNGSR